jgi:formylmethanofuran dehydrogenase subunit C
MNALTFTLKQRTEQRVDMSPLACHLLAGKEPAEIAAITLQNGKRKLRVDELFSISGYDAQNIVIKNSFGKLDYIGKDLQGGKITVEGSAGAYLALGMKSGSISVHGDVGIFAACEMKNGTLTIYGNAGDFLGGALVGNKKGMQGGLVLVKGNAGERVGDHLRRGTILIEGNAGDYCGSRMIAGTIAVLGKTGRHLGYAMNRGTLLLWNTPEMPATFNDCGAHTLTFLPIFFASFRNLDSRFAQTGVAFNRAQRYGGDMSASGRGEVLVKL